MKRSLSYLTIVIIFFIPIINTNNNSKVELEEKCKLKVEGIKGTIFNLSEGKIILTKTECILEPNEQVDLNAKKSIKLPKGFTSIKLNNISFEIKDIKNIEVKKDTLIFQTCKSELCDKVCTIISKKVGIIKEKIISLQEDATK